MAKRHVDSLKAKQKKQKIIAAVLGVVFLGVAAFQGPKLWKQLHPPPSVQRDYTQTTTTTASGTPSLAAPTLGGSQAPGTTPAPSGSLASAPVPVLADGQLTSFSRFASKDPFSQQLSEKGPGTSGSSSSFLGRFDLELGWRQDAVRRRQCQRSDAGHGGHLRQRDALHGLRRQ